MATLHRTSLSARSSTFVLMTLGLLSVVGCFKHPRVADKVMTCTSDDNCLVGYSCVAGTCQLPGQDAAVPADTRSDLAPPTDTPTTVDAAIQIDAPIADVTVPGTGGVPIATGGITTTGGSPATGGITSTGGSTSTDGSTSTGGISIATGGTGVVSTGGIPGTGGTTVVTGGIVVATGGQNTGGTSISPNLECSRPVNPINGVVSAPILTVGSIAAYDCYTGHQLQGVAQRTCQADLSWSGTAPICAPVDCGPLTAPTNGTVTALDTTYDNRAIYTCVNGTTMTGARARTCQADGTWSGTAPTCECAFTFCDGTCADLQTSNQNCGACGTVCAAPSPSRAQCNLGRCMVALADSMYPGGIGVSGSSFVWTEGVAQTVMKIPVGGGPTTILASDQDGMENLAVDATNAYWTTLNDNHVMKVPLAGGTPVVLAANENAIGIAVDTTHVYWGVSLGSLKKIPIAGGEPTTIATGINSTIVVSGTDIYWGTAAGVSKGPVSGLSATPLVADPGKWFFAVGATHIFWTNKDAGTVMKMPLQGGAATAVATGLEEPYDVAVDSTHVYWGCGKFPFKIMKAPIAGGTPVTIASGEAIPQRMVVDGTSVYWGTINPGIVWRVTPK